MPSSMALEGRRARLFPVDDDRAAVGGLGAGEDLHERRFSRPVLTDHGKDLPARQREINVGDGNDRRGTLCGSPSFREHSHPYGFEPPLADGAGTVYGAFLPSITIRPAPGTEAGACLDPRAGNGTGKGELLREYGRDVLPPDDEVLVVVHDRDVLAIEDVDARGMM